MPVTLRVCHLVGRLRISYRRLTSIAAVALFFAFVFALALALVVEGGAAGKGS